MTTLIIIFLASYRLTHLVVFDKIFEPVRNLFVRRYYSISTEGLRIRYELQGGPVRGFIGMIMNCFWCAGIWVSFGVAALYQWDPDGMYWLLVALAAAGVVGILETWWAKMVGYPEMEPLERERP